MEEEEVRLEGQTPQCFSVNIKQAYQDLKTIEKDKENSGIKLL